ncbi:MAG: tRNA guanosine(34) transglycosylase Tgt [Thermoplasmata archaeon]
MFKVQAEDERSSARTGILRTPHGDLETPAFLPVATKGVVKTLTPDELRSIGTHGIIVNSFHFLLRGRDAVAKAGGIHNFMNWDDVIFTDCGGFQLIRKDFSLRLSDEGISFKLRKDEPYLLDPARSLRLQEKMGSDVAFSLDDCPPLGSSRKRILLSTERTTKWAKESLAARKSENTLLFGIVQGGLDSKLREDHARVIAEEDFDGIGIGGLSLGEPEETTVAMVQASLKSLSRDLPRHLLGVGGLQELKRYVSMGVDIFDSAFPARNARHGTFYAGAETYDIRKRRFEASADSLDRGCDCYACLEFTSGYIHHLFREKEMLAMRLLSIHNLATVEEWMAAMRTSIKEGTFIPPTA